MACKPACADCQCSAPKVNISLSVDDAAFLRDRGPWGYNEREERILNALDAALAPHK